MPKTKPLALQVLFEPFPNPAADGYTWNRDGAEVFAGNYWIDALDADGRFIERGFRAQVTGCTTCYRHAEDTRAHWPNLNTFPNRKKMIRCPKWKRVEAIVKAFGGWKHVHYVELREYEWLRWQPIPQRSRVYEGPLPLDRFGMTDEQRRMRRPDVV